MVVGCLDVYDCVYVIVGGFGVDYVFDVVFGVVNRVDLVGDLMVFVVDVDAFADLVCCGGGGYVVCFF